MPERITDKDIHAAAGVPDEAGSRPEDATALPEGVDDSDDTEDVSEEAESADAPPPIPVVIMPDAREQTAASRASSVAVEPPATESSTLDVTREDLDALGDEYRAGDSLADELRDGFRDVKRAQGQARRLLTLLRGLSRKIESEAHRTSDEVTQLVESIQRTSEER